MDNKGVLDDPEFCSLFLRVLSFNRLDGKEIKYLLLRFYCHKTCDEISKFDDLKTSRQRINQVLEGAYRKIKIDYKNKYVLL